MEKRLEREQHVLCLVSQEMLRSTKTALYQDIRCLSASNKTPFFRLNAKFHHKMKPGYWTIVPFTIHKHFNTFYLCPLHLPWTFSQVCCAITLSYFWRDNFKLVFLLRCSHKRQTRRQTQDSTKLLLCYGNFLEIAHKPAINAEMMRKCSTLSLGLFYYKNL